MVGGSNSLLFFLKRKLLAEKNRFERGNVAYILGLVNTINTIYKANRQSAPRPRKQKTSDSAGPSQRRSGQIPSAC